MVKIQTVSIIFSTLTRVFLYHLDWSAWLASDKTKGLVEYHPALVCCGSQTHIFLWKKCWLWVTLSWRVFLWLWHWPTWLHPLRSYHYSWLHQHSEYLTAPQLQWASECGADKWGQQCPSANAGHPFAGDRAISLLPARPKAWRAKQASQCVWGKEQSPPASFRKLLPRQTTHKPWAPFRNSNCGLM